MEDLRPSHHNRHLILLESASVAHVIKDRDNRSQPNRFLLRYGERILEARAGCRLLDVILEHHIDHRHICGGNGFCTSCRVEVLQGSEHLSPVSALERHRLGREAGRLRLACQTQVDGPVHVRAPRATFGRFSPDGDGSD